MKRVRPPKRVGVDRPPIERMAFLARLFREGKRVTVGLVAARFEVSHKTIERDIAFMRDRLGYKIEWRMKGLAPDQFTYVAKPPAERVL